MRVRIILAGIAALGCGLPVCGQNATPLSDLLAEAARANPGILAAQHAWRASTHVRQQVTTLPNPQFTLQEFSVGSPKPFAGFNTSNFAYFGIGASQELPYPGKLRLKGEAADRAADAQRAQIAVVLVQAAKQVGPALFFSLLIIVVSFLPVFLLEAQEGRMFRPLAWTKTLAVGSSSLLAITLVPELMTLLIRGRLRPERANPVSRFTQALYLPVLRFCLRRRVLAIFVNLLFLVVTLPLALRLGSQFMPPLFEGSALYMPTALPGVSIGQATALLGEQDRILRNFPEIQSVFGSVGRSDSATDNAPLDMYDTTIMLKPRELWPAGMTYDKLTQEMDAKLQFSWSCKHVDDAG